MNKIIIGACVIIAYCFSSCANKEPDYDTSLMISDSSKPATIIPGSPNLVKPVTTLPGIVQAMKAPLPQPSVFQASSIIAPGVNPPHGQPNHRCDIAVGAPLNLLATTPATQIVSPAITPAAQTTAPLAQKTTARTVTPAGMNPPHGEPEHRCDIAVGAPLNSPVKSPATQTVSTTTIPAAQKTTARTVTPAGMNPPHGEPKHRCDIAVGAPLNSPVKKPTTKTDTSTPVIAPLSDSGS